MFSAFSQFAQDYTYYTYSTPTGESSGLSAFMIAYLLIMTVVGLVVLVSLWRIFKKAGRPGWAAIIPIYNCLMLFKIVGRPWWWIFIVLISAIPFVGLIAGTVVAIIIANDLAKSFRKGTGMAIAIFFVVGLPVLAFGDAQYHGPAALNTPGGPAALTTAPKDGAQPAA